MSFRWVHRTPLKSTAPVRYSVGRLAKAASGPREKKLLAYVARLLCRTRHHYMRSLYVTV